MNAYDDSYKMLASAIAVNYNVENAKRMLADKDYIRQIIQAEVRENIDISGPFSDCVVTGLIHNKQKVLYRNALNALGFFLYKQLDIDRFRDELRKFYLDMEIEISEKDTPKLSEK